MFLPGFFTTLSPPQIFEQSLFFFFIQKSFFWLFRLQSRYLRRKAQRRKGPLPALRPLLLIQSLNMVSSVRAAGSYFHRPNWRGWATTDFRLLLLLLLSLKNLNDKAAAKKKEGVGPSDSPFPMMSPTYPSFTLLSLSLPPFRYGMEGRWEGRYCNAEIAFYHSGSESKCFHIQ